MLKNTTIGKSQAIQNNVPSSRLVHGRRQRTRLSSGMTAKSAMGNNQLIWSLNELWNNLRTPGVPVSNMPELPPEL
jgi:hypothetical protein